MAKPSEAFGKNLKTALGDRSQSWLAKQADTTPAAISDVINGKTFPTLRTAERLADAVGVPLIDLLKHQAPKSPPRSLESLRIEAIRLIAVADIADVTGVLLTLKGEPRS